jgi:hypothetical protein
MHIPRNFVVAVCFTLHVHICLRNLQSSRLYRKLFIKHHQDEQSFRYLSVMWLDQNWGRMFPIRLLEFILWHDASRSMLCMRQSATFSSLCEWYEKKKEYIHTCNLRYVAQFEGPYIVLLFCGNHETVHKKSRKLSVKMEGNIEL